MKHRFRRRSLVMASHGAGDLESVTKSCRCHPTIRKEGDQSDLVRRQGVVGIVDSTQHGQQRVHRLITPTHAFHGKHGTAHSHDQFTTAGCGHGSDVRVDVQAMTDDGRISDSTGHLPRGTTRGAGPREYSMGIKSQSADRVMSRPTLFVISTEQATSITIDRSTGIADQIDIDPFGTPSVPCFACSRGKQFSLGLSCGMGKRISRLTGQHDVLGVIHDSTCNPRRVQMSTQAADTAACRRRLHDACVQRDHPIAIGQTTESNRVDLGIGLDPGRGGDDCIQRTSTGIEIRPSGLMASESE